MLAVALLLFAQGLPLFEGLSRRCAQLMTIMPRSIIQTSLYFSFFSVFASGFIITFALMLQPHILTKVLYLRSEADLGKFIATTVVVGFLFTLVLFIGFLQGFLGLEVSSQDAVVVEYLNHTLIGTDSSGLLLTFIMLTLLAAGMSTLMASLSPYRQWWSTGATIPQWTPLVAMGSGLGDVTGVEFAASHRSFCPEGGLRPCSRLVGADAFWRALQAAVASLARLWRLADWPVWTFFTASRRWY